MVSARMAPMSEQLTSLQFMITSYMERHDPPKPSTSRKSPDEVLQDAHVSQDVLTSFQPIQTRPVSEEGTPSTTNFLPDYSNQQANLYDEISTSPLQYLQQVSSEDLGGDEVLDSFPLEAQVSTPDPYLHLEDGTQTCQKSIELDCPAGTTSASASKLAENTWFRLPPMAKVEGTYPS